MVAVPMGQTMSGYYKVFRGRQQIPYKKRVPHSVGMVYADGKNARWLVAGVDGCGQFTLAAAGAVLL